MTNANLIRFVALLAAVVLWPAQSPAQEYVLTVGNEQLRFVAQPEAGYVVKTQEKAGGISTLSSTLSFLASEHATPIGGPDRHGIWVVERQQPASENEKTIKMLRADRQIEYAAPLFSSDGETVAIIPEIVIRVHPGVDARQVHFLCQSLALAIIKPMEFTTQEYLLQVLGPDAEAVFTALENLNNVEWVEWAAPNTASQPKLCGQVIPNDEYFLNQWHLNNTGQSGGTPGADIRDPEAWEITTGDPNIVIAVIDSGVDSNHPDLVDNLVPGYDFYDNDDRPDPSTDHPVNAHGTACAGLIAARGNNGIGVAGVTWNCGIMPIRIFRVGANGTEYFITQDDRATALRWAAAHGADILSNSWVWGKNPLPIIYSGILDVTKSGGMGRDGKGCIVLFGAGNDSGSVFYPARYPEVIAVGASDHNDMRCYYSSYGPELDIVAPSGPGCTMDDWLTTKRKGWPWTTDISGLAGWNMDPFDPNIVDYTALGGTSGACPVAAGISALILSVDPNLTNTQVQYILERSAHDLGAPGRDDYYGWGRVDARAALERLLRTRADLDGDGRVNLKDFSKLAQDWSEYDAPADIVPGPYNERKVDYVDLAILAKNWLTAIRIPPGPSQAENPSPADLASVTDVDADLSWTPGSDTLSHGVYFGKTNPPPFVCNQTETTFDPGTLEQGPTTYYWRIDEINGWGKTEGTVWSFTVVPKLNYNPNPAHQATFVPVTTDLSWSKGALALLGHIIYLSTDFATVNNAVPGTTTGVPGYLPPTPPQTVASLTRTIPGDLLYNTTYYWRADGVEKAPPATPGNTHKGEVWRFTTGP